MAVVESMRGESIDNTSVDTPSPCTKLKIVPSTLDQFLNSDRPKGQWWTPPTSVHTPK